MMMIWVVLFSPPSESERDGKGTGGAAGGGGDCSPSVTATLCSTMPLTGRPAACRAVSSAPATGGRSPIREEHSEKDSQPAKQVRDIGE